MPRKYLRSYLANLPVGQLPLAIEGFDPDAIGAVDIDELPDRVVIGSNLVQFSKEASPQVRSSVALSLLVAQRVAATDSVILTPQQWTERHNTVLGNLNWHMESSGTQSCKFGDVNVAVHEGIIPFLVAMFGGSFGTAALLLSAMKGLKDIDMAC